MIRLWEVYQNKGSNMNESIVMPFRLKTSNINERGGE